MSVDRSASSIGAAIVALGLPDVTGLPEPENLSPEDCATLVMALRAQLAEADRLYADLCRPVYEVLKAANSRVLGAMIDARGTMLPHDQFDVVLDQPNRRDKRIDILRSELRGKLPDDLYAQAIFPKAIEGTIDPSVLAAAEATGASIRWDADLRKLDTFARKFGGEIASIVERGSPRVDVGQPVVKITPRASAMKAVS